MEMDQIKSQRDVGNRRRKVVIKKVDIRHVMVVKARINHSLMGIVSPIRFVTC